MEPVPKKRKTPQPASRISYTHFNDVWSGLFAQKKFDTVSALDKECKNLLDLLTDEKACSQDFPFFLEIKSLLPANDLFNNLTLSSKDTLTQEQITKSITFYSFLSFIQTNAPLLKASEPVEDSWSSKIYGPLFAMNTDHSNSKGSFAIEKEIFPLTNIKMTELETNLDKLINNNIGLIVDFSGGFKSSSPTSVLEDIFAVVELEPYKTTGNTKISSATDHGTYQGFVSALCFLEMRKKKFGCDSLKASSIPIPVIVCIGHMVSLWGVQITDTSRPYIFTELMSKMDITNDKELWTVAKIVVNLKTLAKLVKATYFLK